MNSVAYFGKKVLEEKVRWVSLVDLDLDDYELMECIDEGLGIFGQNVRYTVYWRIAYLNNLPYSGILVNPEAFVEALQTIFGLAAIQIEHVIMQRIKERFELLDLECSSLPEVIRYARRQCVYL